MDINECFDEFLNYLLSEKNVSQLTITSYKNDFKLFTSFLINYDIKPRLNSITTPIIRKYLSFLKIEKSFKTNTLRRKIHSLSSFYKFLMEQEYIEKNPMLPIHAPQEEKTLPIYLVEDELRRLISAPMKHSKDHKLRDKCILETLIFTGIRRQELLSLNWSNIDFNKQTILVRKGKGKKDRVVPLPEPLSTDLWAYLQTRLPLINDALFISDLDNRLSITALQQLFKRYLKLSGLENKGYTIHKLRHSYASLLSQAGVDLISIKELLGHEDLNSTKVYTHVTVNTLRKEVNKFPLCNKVT